MSKSFQQMYLEEDEVKGNQKALILLIIFICVFVYVALTANIFHNNESITTSLRSKGVDVLSITRVSTGIVRDSIIAVTVSTKDGIVEKTYAVDSNITGAIELEEVKNDA